MLRSLVGSEMCIRDSEEEAEEAGDDGAYEGDEVNTPFSDGIKAVSSHPSCSSTTFSSHRNPLLAPTLMSGDVVDGGKALRRPFSGNVTHNTTSSVSGPDVPHTRRHSRSSYGSPNSRSATAVNHRSLPTSAYSYNSGDEQQFGSTGFQSGEEYSEGNHDTPAYPTTNNNNKRSSYHRVGNGQEYDPDYGSVEYDDADEEEEGDVEQPYTDEESEYPYEEEEEGEGLEDDEEQPEPFGTQSMLESQNYTDEPDAVSYTHLTLPTKRIV
eukprot:TRINITY_DN24318_c0_g1_i2.p1 TRINITY_DN24318_c0_g1~~TRINITY_DN24318_c0_g1_i2.p1  ORF type:complete len:268 (-),score=50.61 TRINITY_DN24318_c0_g1_i2:177-980(-)